ncbi:sushi, von Willebrand factor type A, EGF and pentraxin domain-containing protein 1 [Epargyreus clarus]|uniref:sushi, von Willebrand factor type A, EGF and pentraxin domain-containing protein 1 n=1 Tax=Epargyreus clarus TaxID=520877 RepID=UPI003C2BE89C
MYKYQLLFVVMLAASLMMVSSLPSPTTDDDDDEDDTTPTRADSDDGRIYKNPRNSPSAQCPRDEEQATMLGQKCLRKCSSDEDCKSKKKKCLCDGACGMSCIKPDRECPELEQPDIGTVVLSGRLFGDKAAYSCPQDYHVVGLQSRSCQADGKWAGQPPACKENIYCLQPPTIEHARHSALPEQATFDLDATVQYNCHTGYTTNGFPRAKCLAIDGHASWYGPDISCEPRSCGEPGDVPHGWVTADCHTFGCRAVVQCGQGFELVGKAERYCQADGAWAPKELPTCVLVTQVQCPPPEAPRHGKAVYTSCAYNSVVSYECKYGYRLVGDATRRCGADKKWSGTQPICKEINCGHPGQLWNGWLENISSGTGLGASIIFRCQDGMKMEGNGSGICQNDGTWSHPLPMCLAPCVVPHVSQGKVVLMENRTGGNDTHEHTQIVGSSSMVQHGDMIVVDCEKNYEFPSNNLAVICNNGTWTQIPRCQPARCKKMPKYPRNGMVMAPKTEHGMKARFRCKDGYELKGNPIVICSFGNWSGETPRCEEVFCPFPGYIENGKVLLVGNMGLYDYRPYVKKVVNNKQIMYECDKGYVLSEGPPGATCVGGHWSPRELPKCTLYQHPRIRWSRRRRSVTEPEIRHRRSAYLRQYYNNLRRHSAEPDQHHVDELYDKYNHDTRKPTLRHANFKLMKKFDLEFLEDDDIAPSDTDTPDGENFPTAVYTVYNVHGEPIGHRLYSYQPVYEPEEDEVVHHDEVPDYEDSSEFDDNPHMTILKGGMFPDHEQESHEEIADNINKLKHQYFEKYVDKRRKRFLNQKSGESDSGDNRKSGETESGEKQKSGESSEVNKDKTLVDVELQGAESNVIATQKLIRKTKSRTKRNVITEETDTEIQTVRPYETDAKLIDDIEIDLLKVIPLPKAKNETNDVYKKEVAVIPIQYVKTNSTEVDNILEKRDKRTSRKTDRLNQTTATVPKTGREGKGGRNRQRESLTAEDKDASEAKEGENGNGNKTETEKSKKGRPKSPCEAIESEPYVNIEIVKYGRDPNNTFSSGTIVRVACGKGYGLNLELNATAKCVRGRWKPEKPKCEILPCHVPTTEYGIYTMPQDSGLGSQMVSGLTHGDEKELNETDPVPNGQVVHFSCEYGYNVQGPTNLRCWLGEWAVTSMPECVAAPCELPLLHGATYEAGYRAGLTVAHASSVNIACEPGRSPPATLNCHLGRLQPTVHDFCRPLANLSRPRPTSEYQSGSDIVREDISELEPDLLGKAVSECGPPARVQGTLIYRDGAEVNGTLGVEGYPHGTEITFRCIASIMGERTTWKLICEQGDWVGKSFNCEELEAQSEELLNNNTCTFRNEEPHVVSFFNDLEITETVDFPPGAVIISRCSDIGKYAMTGSQTRKCIGGSWDGTKPTCFGLNQENDYAMEKPPTILFRYSQGPIAQTNDGKLLVYPGTVLHMECLWMRRFGNPKWNVTHFYPDIERKYQEGWTDDPGRDSQLEYRLSILGAEKEDSGVYRCETPARQSHQVEIIVEDVHCPPLPIRRGLVASGLGTMLGTEIKFSCANGNALLGAHTLACRASGNWSAPLPVCESVECGEVVHDTPLKEGERRPRVAVVSRGVGGRAAFSCPAGWALSGAAETVCLPAADWARPFPVCREVSCPALPPPASGYVLGRAPYRAGDVLQFHCNPEHTLHGRPILVCQDSGRWSDKPPTCAQACTYPGTTISGRMSSVKFYYKIGETVSFTCEPGYRLKGAPMLRCLKNRKWSNAIPLCAPITNYTSPDSLAMLNGDIDAMLSDSAILPSDILKTRETPAILSPESYKAAVTRVAASRLFHRAPIETYKNRITRINRFIRRDTER